MRLIRTTTPRYTGSLDRLLNDAFGSLGNITSVFDRVAPPIRVEASRLPMDLYEDEGNYHARFEVPGFTRADIGIELDKGVLAVAVGKASATVDDADKASSSESETPLARERYRRVVRLPEGADPDKVTAKLEDGILTVTVAKPEEDKPRRVEID